MRVLASGNLTVELIRAQRFDVACRTDKSEQKHCEPCYQDEQTRLPHRNDRVELSREALADDRWTLGLPHVVQPCLPTEETCLQREQPGIELPPKKLSPVVGSTALAGLGTAWMVPGTLLDVVA